MASSTAVYQYEWLVIHGPASNARYRARGTAYVNQIVGWGSTSHNGNPAFCMRLRITDFFQNPDRSVGFTIYIAELRKLRYQGYFGYPFTVYASIWVQNANGSWSMKSKVSLFSKPGSASTWGDRQYKMSGTRTLTATRPTANSKVKLRISILSVCTCAQSGVDTPVYEDDMTEYIPPVTPYVWRKFGLNATEDPEGALISSENLDGNWHLVRPLYFCKEYVDSTSGETRKAWFNVEEPDKVPGG